jgi:hypothetical protein
MPVEGDYTNGHTSVEQKPIEALAPSLQALLDHEVVKAVRWEQYTPYFNDGDVCEFGVNEPEVGFLDVTGDIIWSEENNSEWLALAGGMRYTGRYDEKGQWGYAKEEIVGTYPGLDDLLSTFHKELASGSYDDALLEIFGDHAQIVIMPGEPIQVEFYKHD